MNIAIAVVILISFICVHFIKMMRLYLIVMDRKDDNVILSARNIPDVTTVTSNAINVFDILKYGNMVITKDAVQQIEEVYA